jgi:hypothetical protein
MESRIKKSEGRTSAQYYLSRQRGTQVLASILGVDVVEVVSAWPDVIDRAFGGVIDGIVVLLAKLCNST